MWGFELTSTITKAGMGWGVGGHAKLSAIQAQTGFLFPIDEVEQPPTTLNDWVTKKLNRPVDAGETIVSDGLRIVVRKVRRQCPRSTNYANRRLGITL